MSNVDEMEMSKNRATHCLQNEKMKKKTNL